jgi:hypothetical protein
MAPSVDLWISERSSAIDNEMNGNICEQEPVWSLEFPPEMVLVAKWEVYAESQNRWTIIAGTSYVFVSELTTPNTAAHLFSPVEACPFAEALMASPSFHLGTESPEPYS